MLPTQTLNPTIAAGAAPTKRAANNKRDQESNGNAEDAHWEEIQQRLYRAAHHPDAPLNKNVLVSGRKAERYNPDKFWWAGVGLVAVGTVLYMWPTKQEQTQ
jgi:hypothetical protein